jgi:hypothetical protein
LLRQQNPLLESIQFLGDTPMESTGLAAGSQDMVISQFGFEYGDLHPTLKEIKRLLKPESSHFIAMIHHENSAILRQAREALQQITRCEKSGVAELAEDLIRLQQELAAKGTLSPRQQQKAQQLHRQFTQGLDKLQRYSGQLKDSTHTRMFIQNLMVMFDRRNALRIAPGQRLHAISRLRDDQQNYRQRMRDLRAAAFSDQAFSNLQYEFRALGFHIEANDPLDYAEQHFCNSLVSRLSA